MRWDEKGALGSAHEGICKTPNGLKEVEIGDKRGVPRAPLLVLVAAGGESCQWRGRSKASSLNPPRFGIKNVSIIGLAP